MNYPTTICSGKTFVILIYFVLFTVASCKFPVYVLTDEKLKEHYKDRKIKPELKYLNYKNYHIYHAIIGDTAKPLFLYIHGAPGAWYSSLRLLDDTALQRNFRMISIDRVGFGKSNYGLSVSSIDQHVRYIEKIVKEYNAVGRKIYLMGSSYGAPIAASFVTQNPDLVEELYLVSPVIDPATEKNFWFSYAAKLGPVSWFLPQSLNVTSDEKFAHRRELRKLKPHWKEITCKTYVIMGAKDWIADKSNFTFAQKVLVNAYEPEFIMLDDVGHVIVYRRPDLLKNLFAEERP